MSLPLPRLGASTIIKPTNVANSTAGSKTAVGPKKHRGPKATRAAVEARPLVSLPTEPSSAPGPKAPVSVGAPIRNASHPDVLAVWTGPRAHPARRSEDGAAPSAGDAAAAAAAGSPRAAGVLHIGEIPIASVPAEPAAAPAAEPAVRAVAAAAVAAAAGQQASAGAGAAPEPPSNAYMAGVAAGVAAMVAQQQAAAAAAAHHHQQHHEPAQQPQQHQGAPPAYYPHQYWDPQQQQPHPQQPPQAQQQLFYAPPPPHYYMQPYPGYPLPQHPGFPPFPQQPAPYGQPPVAPYYPHYDPRSASWPAEDGVGAGAGAGSSAASEASYYPATPVPSTPTGASSVAASSAAPFGGRRGGGRGDTVTVSAASSVKDAAGAVAKVLERQGSCLLVALRRSGEAGSGATHVAAKTLAVSRFYVNARMGAGGAAGGAAARALVAAAEGRAAGAGAGAAAAEEAAGADAGKEEVTFVPFQRSSRPQDADQLGFVVFKVRSGDLPVPLPPPVGQPSALSAPRGEQPQAQAQQQAQEEEQQQEQEQQPAAAEPPLLKAGAGTDVNKLSNAVIRNVLEWGRVSLQLAGPAACHVAMFALAKARARLARKFAVSIAVASAFSTEDTSGSLGRATVFYRLDVLRVSGAAAEAAAAGWSAAGLAGADEGGDGASSFGGW
ncbi:hypothetical protein Rsub_00578 [Raphidocelis subcapitata]|uniref:Uncharacterized protein n=1 Tax=Raphidocelis subcapitata TaxID=307507 RepID=A0A2V0NKL1_9CHLO|nr:hypothetical protein Rsub_00578 [Raphidocelis subcapitata]|eukprot:GBF87866.1 hypothetical protein Rsub_00578 [Raphidocelis subcapitata]